MSTLLLLTRREGAKALIQWTARLADTRPGSLMVLCCSEGYPVRDMTPVTTERIISGEGLLRTAKSALDELGLSADVLWELKHPDLITAILDEIEKRRIDLLVAGTDGTLGPENPLNYLANRMLRFAAVDTVLIDPGRENPDDLKRIIVPMGGVLVSPTLKAASGMVRRGGVVSPLLVGPEFGSDSRAVARRELDLKLQEIDIGDTQQFVPEVAIADRAIDGIVKAGQQGDMILLGASTDKVLFQLRKKQMESGPAAEGTACAIGLYRPARETAPGFRSAFAKRIFQWLPKLNPTERIKMFDRLQLGSRANPDFLVMMGLSTGIASLGLMQGSTAVVIGAMLVAPLMTPLIGAGFALVQGNVRLFRQSMAAMGIGILTGLVLSLLISMLSPKDDLSLEIVARASPDILDIFIALLSGMAAAYAFARPTLMGTLAGVAIAAALVPPLATVGIGLSRGALEVAKGAAILHLTNLVAITFGAAVIFRLLGVQGTRLGIGPNLWMRRSLLILVLIVTLLFLPLGYMTASKLAKGQSRPLAFPLSAELSQLIVDRVDKEPNVTLVMAGRSAFVEDRNEVGIVLSCEGPVSVELKRDLRQMVLRAFNGDAKVWVHVLQRSPIDQDVEQKENALK